MILVQLDQLHSPKRLISRSDPRHNYSALEAAMRTIIGRPKIPRISIQPLGSPAQPTSVPLALVQISN